MPNVPLVNIDSSRVRYHESSPLRDLRDSDSTGKQWKRNLRDAAQGYGSQKAIEQLRREVEKIRRRVVTIPPQYGIQPFTIYPIPNYTNAGNSLYTFQIRSGFVSSRSVYQLPSGTLGLQGFPNTILLSNYEQALFVLSDIGSPYDNQYASASGSTYTPYGTGILGSLNVLLPAVPNTGGDMLLADATDTLISSAYNLGPPPQIVLQQTYDSNSTINAAFWVNITDSDPSTGGGFYASLYGRMFGSSLGRNANPFPNPAANIIPIGIIQIIGSPQPNYQNPVGTFITQYQIGNLVNRYTGALNYRGAWTANSLSGKVFYNGDVILDDSGTSTKTTTSGTFTYNKLWEFVGGASGVSSPPSSTPTGWQYIGAYL